MKNFTHLHVHTQYSLLDGALRLDDLFKKAKELKLPAIASTDHGNMFGVFQFVGEAFKHKNEDGSLKVKPIVGCEFYVVEDRHKKKFTDGTRDVGNVEGPKDGLCEGPLDVGCVLGALDGLTEGCFDVGSDVGREVGATDGEPDGL
jgi:hypothetical protein